MELGGVAERLQERRHAAKCVRHQRDALPVRRENLEVDGAGRSIEAEEATRARPVAHRDNAGDRGSGEESFGPELPTDFARIGRVRKPWQVGILVERPGVQAIRTDVHHAECSRQLLVRPLQAQLVGHPAASRRMVVDIVDAPCDQRDP